MKQTEFIKLLAKTLNENKVIDIEEIVEEYNDHYEYKLLDGYTEDEISKKLGNPTDLASQYETSDITQSESSHKVLIYTGLLFGDIFMAMFYIILISWIIVSSAFSVVNFAIFGTLFIGVIPFSWFPVIPYWCGAILSISLLSLGVFMIVVTYYSYLYLKQVFKSYKRFHNNSINQVCHRPTLPSISSTPILNKKTSRLVRKVIQLSLTTFAVSFILGYVVCSITSGNIEFWHAFGWFQ